MTFLLWGGLIWLTILALSIGVIWYLWPDRKDDAPVEFTEQDAADLTTEQLTSAPAGALYVWPNSRTLHYIRDLAYYWGRTDLEIIPKWKLLEPDFCAGRRFSAIIVDHACELTADEATGLAQIRKCVDRNLSYEPDGRAG